MFSIRWIRILLQLALGFPLFQLKQTEALQLQTIQFSTIPSYNHSENECAQNLNFSSSYTGKIPNLEAILNYNISNIRQTRLTGMWGLYSEKNYTGDSLRSVWTKDGTCVYESGLLSPSYRSMRYLSNSDVDSVGLSLYPGDGKVVFDSHLPVGQEWYTDKEEFNLTSPMCVAFWASTGNTSWTVFSTTDLSGPSACLRRTRGANFSMGSVDYLFIGSAHMGESETCEEVDFFNPNWSIPVTDELKSCKYLWTATSDAYLVHFRISLENCILILCTLSLVMFPRKN